MAKILLFGLLFFVATIRPNAQKVTFICRVDSVISQGKNKVEFIAIREDNCEKITLMYAFYSFTTRPGTIRRGTWLTVVYRPGNCVDNWAKCKIKFGRK